MAVSIGIQLADCTTIVVPGWSAVVVVAIAAAPRLVSRLLEARQ